MAKPLASSAILQLIKNSNAETFTGLSLWQLCEITGLKQKTVSHSTAFLLRENKIKFHRDDKYRTSDMADPSRSPSFFA
jgi:hypothetical protein